MINLDQAFDLIDQNLLSLGSELVSVADSSGRILFTDIFAPINLPPFKNSAVDGFAVRSKDLSPDKILPVLTTVHAQGQAKTVLKPKTAIKIMTGAPMPVGADTVVMLENVEPSELGIKIARPHKLYDNVRFSGEDIERGQKVFNKGDKISPQIIGTLLGLGISTVEVFTPPRIKIICTGDELIEAPQPLEYGQVYYLLGPMLKAQARNVGAIDCSVVRLPDSKNLISIALQAALDADIVLLCGGMSKGEHDFGPQVLSQSGVSTIFYKGYWRPGKPLFFGRTDKARVFGLPGNPVAAFVCFDIFVRRLLLLSMAHGAAAKFNTAPLAHDFDKKAGFDIFARAKLNEIGSLEILSGQGSHQIYTLSQASVLALLPKESTIVKKGELVQYCSI